ncbi:MAG: zf-HC2 domain-containing protein [Acidobacteriaceae bacterium]
MNHQDATQSMAVEKYVLNELPPELRDEFEEHFFECPECAMDLRATAAFLDAAKAEFKAAAVSKPLPLTTFKKQASWAWRPMFAIPALAACLLFILYQNAVVFPRLHHQIAQFSAPEIMPSVSLIGGNSRGGTIPSITIPPDHPFLLFMDIPTQDRFSTYTCSLYSPTGKLAWQFQVSSQQAKDTISVSIPAADRVDGKYSLLVQGNTGPSSPQAPVDLAWYSFLLNNQK